MMNMKTYFERPKQVVFADPDNPGEWLVGIAHRDEIICACCGGVFEIDEVINMAIEDGVTNPIYEYEDWVDIAYEIAGDGLPIGLVECHGKIVETSFDNCHKDGEPKTWVFHIPVEEEEESSEDEVHYFANTWVDGIAMPNASGE